MSAGSTILNEIPPPSLPLCSAIKKIYRLCRRHSEKGRYPSESLPSQTRISWETSSGSERLRTPRLPGTYRRFPPRFTNGLDENVSRNLQMLVEPANHFQ